MKSILIIITLAVCGFGKIQSGDTYTSFFFYQSDGDSMMYGCEGHLSIYSALRDVKLSTFWMPKYHWWQKMFPSVSIGIDIIVNDSVPPNVIQFSDEFNDAQWFTGIKHGSDSIDIVFPIIDTEYGPHGNYVVDVNDSVYLFVYSINDSVMVGSFVDKQLGDTDSVKIVAKNAIVISTTSSNNMRIGSIRFNWQHKSHLIDYLKYDFGTFKSGADWYGVSITDTSYVEPYVKEVVVCDSTIVKDSIVFRDSVVVTTRDSTIFDTSYVVVPRDSIVLKDSIVVTVIDSINLIDSTVVHIKDSINIRDTVVVTVKDSINIIDSIAISIRDSIVVKVRDTLNIIDSVICRDSLILVFDTTKVFDTIPYFRVDSLPKGCYIRNFGMFKNPIITIQEGDE